MSGAPTENISKCASLTRVAKRRPPDRKINSDTHPDCRSPVQDQILYLEATHARSLVFSCVFFAFLLVLANDYSSKTPLFGSLSLVEILTENDYLNFY